MVASAALGSLTFTNWKRRDKAASFSKYFCTRSGGGGDGFQLAARQRWFEQVGYIQPALLVARANQGMCFVDKQNDRHREKMTSAISPLKRFQTHLSPTHRPAMRPVKGHDIGVFSLSGTGLPRCAAPALQSARFYPRLLRPLPPDCFTAAAENVDHQVDFIVAAQYRVKPAVTGVCGHVLA